MSIVCVRAFSVSLDGFGAGPGQDLQNPLGVGGTKLHEWFFGTKTFRTMTGHPETGGLVGGGSEVDERFAQRSFDNLGAWILGRNMFSPVRGPWLNEDWKGWWGEEPPYHVPVFVLTHHARNSLEMKGGTTFHFVTNGITAALDRAKEAARGKDVRIGGGPSIIRQYLEKNLIDEMHLFFSPTMLGTGEPLISGIDLKARGFECVESAPSAKALHVVLQR
jgi:dihydrofolate reductase